ncbi:HD domain-containing protein [Pelomonas sp. APW6]|uniref:HD domain-containing protein n=1 Tax=Roseateles subflavus TaxID=3053353 RepID=A0ABT7LNA6_9BURK|nr:HD domain-containing protein [Pelomonas sp. APW6]MDL5034274.1 HD domain-containing protein [Pelomonas sp. APW6]
MSDHNHPMKILDAYRLAAQLHSGQLDKAGRPYIEHLSRVFLRVMHAGGDRDQQIAALLHDTIEDGKASAESLAAAGVPKGAIVLTQVLTRPAGQDYMAYLREVLKEPRAVPVKLADLDDNSDPDRLALLDAGDAARLAKKYQRAIQFLNSGSA